MSNLIFIRTRRVIKIVIFCFLRWPIVNADYHRWRKLHIGLFSELSMEVTLFAICIRNAPKPRFFPVEQVDWNKHISVSLMLFCRSTQIQMWLRTSGQISCLFFISRNSIKNSSENSMCCTKSNQTHTSKSESFYCHHLYMESRWTAIPPHVAHVLYSTI